MRTHISRDSSGSRVDGRVTIDATAMGDFLEAVVTLLPSAAGGRASAILPRDGSYRPFAETREGARLRIRVIEGPPAIAPGQDGSIVAEIEGPALDLPAGCELDLMEHEQRVGILTVMRVRRAAAV
jgi:hypothetical protein